MNYFAPTEVVTNFIKSTISNPCRKRSIAPYTDIDADSYNVDIHESLLIIYHLARIIAILCRKFCGRAMKY